MLRVLTFLRCAQQESSLRWAAKRLQEELYSVPKPTVLVLFASTNKQRKKINIETKQLRLVHGSYDRVTLLTRKGGTDLFVSRQSQS